VLIERNSPCGSKDTAIVKAYKDYKDYKEDINTHPNKCKLNFITFKLYSKL